MLGYFVEYIGLDGKPQGMGLLKYDTNPEPGRLFGSYGRREETLTEPVTLTKGCNVVTYRASAKRPVQVLTMLHPLEGKTINP